MNAPSNVGRFDKTRRKWYGDTGAPMYLERKMRGLLRATRHVAPYYSAHHLRQSYMLSDARRVVQVYNSGVGVRVLGRQLLARLAKEGR